VGFVVHSLVARAWPRVSAWRSRGGFVVAFGRAAAVLVGIAILLPVTLWAARGYQEAGARRMFNSYLAARKDIVPLTGAPSGAPQEVPRTAPGTNPETADFVEIDVERWRCSATSSITLRYNRELRREFSRRFPIAPADGVHEVTRIFSPIYDHFVGIEMADVPAGCVSGVYRAHDPREIPLMLEVNLPPRWSAMPLYQQFGEPGAPQLDPVP
jgi:hypothetical protein